MTDVSKRFTWDNLPGKGLSSKEYGEVLCIDESPDLAYNWDDGIAIARYLKELKKGRIVARSCEACGRIMIPPRMFCELCYRPTDEWVFTEDTGTVNTFAICHVYWDASRIPEGEPHLLPAVIEIDGASAGMGILHMLGEVDEKAVKIGMRVQAVWKPEAERTGSITDIRYFKPIAE